MPKIKSDAQIDHEDAETARADEAFTEASQNEGLVRRAEIRNGMPAETVRAKLLSAAGFVARPWIGSKPLVK